MLQPLYKQSHNIALMNESNTINLFDALKRMREMSTNNIPFSFSFLSCNTTNGSSDGIKDVSKALLRTGLSRKVSDKSEVLIGYTVEPENYSRWFYAPLLTKFNGMIVKP